MSEFNISYCKLNGVDVSKVTKGPKDLSSIDGTGVLGLEKSTPFKGDISSFDISSSYLHGVDVSKVTKGPQSDYTYSLKWNNLICTLKKQPEEGQDYIGDAIQENKQK